MQPRDLESALVNYTVRFSGHHERRSYMGLSEVGGCERIIYEHYRRGYSTVSVQQRLVTKISFELEAALVERLTAMGIYQAGPEISLHGGLVQGHPDGLVSGDLLEIKTAAMEDHFPEGGRLSRRVFYQVQAYLHFLDLKNAQVLYLARANGAICVVGVRYAPPIGREIEGSVERLVRAAREHREPRCTCGKCGKVKLKPAKVLQTR